MNKIASFLRKHGQGMQILGLLIYAIIILMIFYLLSGLAEQRKTSTSAKNFEIGHWHKIIHHEASEQERT